MPDIDPSPSAKSALDKLLSYLTKAALVSAGILIIAVGLTIWLGPWWRRIPSAPTADEWSALWGMISAVGAIGAVVAAVAAFLVARDQLATAAQQLRDAAEQAKNASLQAEKESFDRNRPYVVASVVPSLAGMGVYDLVLTNLGGSYARSITIGLDEGVIATTHENDHISQSFERLSRFPFDLAPRDSRRMFWSVDPDENADPPLGQGAPPSGRILLKYEWERDGPFGPEFEELFAYDTGGLRDLSPVPDQGPVRRSTDPLASGMLNIEHALRAIARHMGEFRR
ncbi:hypothetical protein [Pseudoclavibacter sp. RFBB5]|uniref:hypothetical protein n=1 Tax=Pseudoclavibacter sp. RFBB5 TaxID=2080574 RepID=UPI000CE8759A|nr:hypothetical protein [Pseudoclavibacter sp. RFBB5]PPG29659.1 hypothetical protein C5B97_11865 [Pseudoclavibacter sp. RFBB5]